MLFFQPPAESLVQVCRNSCFGKSNLLYGIRGFRCIGNESRLTDCANTNTNTSKCDEDAGIVCCKHPHTNNRLVNHFLLHCKKEGAPAAPLGVLPCMFKNSTLGVLLVSTPGVLMVSTPGVLIVSTPGVFCEHY